MEEWQAKRVEAATFGRSRVSRRISQNPATAFRACSELGQAAMNDTEDDSLTDRSHAHAGAVRALAEETMNLAGKTANMRRESDEHFPASAAQIISCDCVQSRATV